MVFTNRDCADLLDQGTEALMEGMPIAYSKWGSHKSQMTTFMTFLEVQACVDKLEVLLNNNPRHFLGVLKSRMFNSIEEAYGAMVEKWGMRPHYFIESFDKDYQDGFVA